jgi:hypothetical protein
MSRNSKTEDKFSVGHHMGHTNGYTVKADGSIQLAPIMADRMRATLHREQGLRGLLGATNAFVAKEWERLAKERAVF